MMRQFAHAMIPMLLSAAAVAAQQSPTQQLPSVDLPPELERVLRDYEKAWSARDAAALAALFAEDGFVLARGRPPVRGRRAIQEHYTGQGGPLSLRAIAYAAEGSVAYVIGGYAARPGGADDGKFTLTLRRGSDGRWLIVSDMDNSNRQSGNTAGDVVRVPVALQECDSRPPPPVPRA